jgi:hypothetical protein
MVTIINTYIDMCIFVFMSHHEQQKFFGKINVLHKRKNKGKNGINNGKRNKKLVRRNKCEKWCTFNFCKCEKGPPPPPSPPPKASMRNMEEDFAKLQEQEGRWRQCFVIYESIAP